MDNTSASEIGAGVGPQAEQPDSSGQRNQQPSASNESSAPQVSQTDQNANKELNASEHEDKKITDGGEKTGETQKANIQGSTDESQDLPDAETHKEQDATAIEDVRDDIKVEVQTEEQIQQELKQANVIGKMGEICLKILKNPKFQAVGVSGLTAIIMSVTNTPHAEEISLIIGGAMGGGTFGDTLGKRARNAIIGATLGTAAFELGPDLPQVGDAFEHAVKAKATGSVGSVADDVLFGTAGVALETGKKVAGGIVRTAIGSRATPKP